VPERMTLEMLERILESISDLKEIERDEDSVSGTYEDKDGDDLLCVVQLLTEERATATVLIPVPDSHSVSAMIVSNLYNNDPEAHGTFVYTTRLGEIWAIVLETHICTRGGVDENTIRHQLRRLVDQVNPFESLVIPAIMDLGPDQSFLLDGFWETLGSFAGEFLQDSNS
jgi:hypothetical protein